MFGLYLSFAHVDAISVIPHCVGPDRFDCAPPLSVSTYPRGPRSGLGYRVPSHHHLIGPIRPARRHIVISPPSGLYAMPSLCGSASATREWFRAFTARSFLACRLLGPRGARSSLVQTSMPTWPSPSSEQLGTPNPPTIRSACQVAADSDEVAQAFRGMSPGVPDMMSPGVPVPRWRIICGIRL